MRFFIKLQFKFTMIYKKYTKLFYYSIIYSIQYIKNILYIK